MWRSADQEEFYQLLTYTDDVDLNEKLAKWERFYNLDRLHEAFNLSEIATQKEIGLS
jgi:transposase InsO family protein